MANINENTFNDTSSTDSSQVAPSVNVSEIVSMAQDKARDIAALVSREVQEHPVRTLAIAAGAGFLLASTFKRGFLPSLIKSGVGVAAAVALRQFAEQGIGTAAGLVSNDMNRS